MLVNYFLVSEIYLKNEKKISYTAIVIPLKKSRQNLWILSHLSESFELSAGCFSKLLLIKALI